MTHDIFDYFKLKKISKMYNRSITTVYKWKHDLVPIPPRIRSHMDSLVNFIENRG